MGVVDEMFADEKPSRVARKPKNKLELPDKTDKPRIIELNPSQGDLLLGSCVLHC